MAGRRCLAQAVWLELGSSWIAGRTIHVVTGEVGLVTGGRVLVYARSVTGGRFGLRIARSSLGGGSDTCEGEIDDVTFEACSGVAS